MSDILFVCLYKDIDCNEFCKECSFGCPLKKQTFLICAGSRPQLQQPIIRTTHYSDSLLFRQPISSHVAIKKYSPVDLLQCHLLTRCIVCKYLFVAINAKILVLLTCTSVTLDNNHYHQQCVF